MVLVLGVQQAGSFALLGPRGQAAGAIDGFEQPIIGYQLGGDIGTPKNLGEEFRRNTPVMYFTMDANFFDYFGSHGSNAIVQAFEQANNIFTNSSGQSVGVSEFNSDLSEFPLSALEFNYQAQALQLSRFEGHRTLAAKALDHPVDRGPAALVQLEKESFEIRRHLDVHAG